MSTIGNTNISSSVVGKAIGVSSHDWSELCTSGNINKWSKHKPVRYPKTTGLIDSEFKGTTADNLNGILYGLAGRVSAVSYKDLHTTTYEYVGRPTGTSDAPYRIGDFRGYDHNARCNLSGVTEEDGSTIYYDIQYPISIYIEYDHLGTNTTGVNLSDFTDNNDSLNVEDYYPCVMIDNYAKALINSQLSEASMADEYTPIFSNGAYYTRFKTSIDLPALKVEADRKVSFFLIKKINDHLIDLTDWVDVTDKAFINPLIAIPEATGLTYHFKAYKVTYYAIATSCRATTNGFSIGWEWEEDKHPTESTEVTFRLDRGDVFGTKTVTYTPPSGGLTPLLYVTFTWSEVGFKPLPGKSVNIAGYITPGGRTFDFNIKAT